MTRTAKGIIAQLRAFYDKQGPTGLRKVGLHPALAAPYGAHSDRLHSTTESAPVARQQPRPRFDLGQRVWFVRGRGKALQPHEGHVGQYGRVDGRQWLGGCWVYEVRCRGRLDVVDEECLAACPAG